MNKPEHCMFCTDEESIQHLFFDCIVAKNVWRVVSGFFNTPLGSDYTSVARFWIANKKHAVLNSVCASVLWSLWKIRNNMVFNGHPWIDIKQVWRMILCSLKRWKLIFKENMLPKMEEMCSFISTLLQEPLQLENG